MTTSSFETQAREILLNNTDDIWDYTTVEVLNKTIVKLLSLHRAELKRAVEVVLDRVEKEVIGANEKHMSFDDDAISRNELREEQRESLAALKEKP